MGVHSITIDIKNQPEVLQLIIDTVPYMPGWTISGNVLGNMGGGGKFHHWEDCRNKTARFYMFRFSDKSVAWVYPDDKGDGKEIVADTPFKMSKVLEYVYQQSEGK